LNLEPASDQGSRFTGFPWHLSLGAGIEKDLSGFIVTASSSRIAYHVNFIKWRGKMEKDHLVVILERMESKLDLVAEGHEVLRSEIQSLTQKTDERFDFVDLKINILNEKIDAVTSDLKAHRRDTEAHQKGYRVSEDA
jgi:hypothetical protein